MRQLIALKAEKAALPRILEYAKHLRRAVISATPNPVPSSFHGHDGPHVAYLPVTDDCGSLRAIGVLPPAEMPEAEIELLRKALSQIDGVPGVSLTLAQLRGWTAFETAQTWATVTPIVAERHRTDFVRLACEYAGLPEPARIKTHQACAHPSFPPARFFRPYSSGRWEHATITWDEPISGPVLLGRDRHFGLGLLLPLEVAL